MNPASPRAPAGGDSVFRNGLLPLVPPLPILLGGAVLWGLLMAACAFLSLVMEDRWQSFHLQKLLLIYFAGGLAAWPVVLPLAHLLARHRTVETRFAACFALLGIGTIAMTVFLFAMDYRQFYAQWHQPFGTRIWLLQFLFTSAGATYQFLVMGLRLYLPVGLPVLAGVSLWLATSMR
jgi:hypothetical protein